MSVPSAVFSLQATIAGGVVTPSAARKLPDNADLSGVLLAVDFSGAPAGTIQGRLQGTVSASDPGSSTAWIDVNDATGAAQAADASEMLGGADQIVPLGQFTHIRVNGAIVGGPPADGSTITAVCKVPIAD